MISKDRLTIERICKGAHLLYGNVRRIINENYINEVKFNLTIGFTVILYVYYVHKGGKENMLEKLKTRKVLVYCVQLFTQLQLQLPTDALLRCTMYICTQYTMNTKTLSH